jgi:hypothetical protein
MSCTYCGDDSPHANLESCVRAIVFARVEKLEMAHSPDKPRVTELPTRQDILHTIFASSGMKGDTSNAIASAVLDLIASRVVVDKPADPVTRKELAELLARFCNIGKTGAPFIADAILKEFGPRLRRQLSRDEWYCFLRSEWHKTDFGRPNIQIEQLTDMLLAKLASLEQS